MQRTPLDFDEIFGCLVRIVKEIGLSKRSFFNFLDLGVWNIQGIFETINDTKYSKLDQPEFENI